jgi:hypothetical protein
VPDGRLGVVVPESAATKDARASKGDAVFLTPDMYAQRDDPYFKTHGFFERSIANRVEEFGDLVEVWSMYESRNAKDDAQPFSRGINSIQIVHAHERFWIASLLFDDERLGLTLPAKYRKTAGYALAQAPWSPASSGAAALPSGRATQHPMQPPAFAVAGL